MSDDIVREFLVESNENLDSLDRELVQLEMSRNVTEAARGAGEISKNISGVAEAAQSTSHGAVDSQKAAAQLAHMSTELRELVGQFKY